MDRILVGLIQIEKTAEEVYFKADSERRALPERISYEIEKKIKEIDAETEKKIEEVYKTAEESPGLRIERIEFENKKNILGIEKIFYDNWENWKKTLTERIISDGPQDNRA